MIDNQWEAGQRHTSTTNSLQKTARTSVGIPFREKGSFARQGNWVQTRGKRDADCIILPVYKDNRFTRVRNVGLGTMFGRFAFTIHPLGTGPIFHERLRYPSFPAQGVPPLTSKIVWR